MDPYAPRKKAMAIGGAALGPAMPREVSEGVVELARLAQTPILGVDFFESGSAWTFASASPRPDFHLAGHSAMRALLAAWNGDRA